MDRFYTDYGTAKCTVSEKTVYHNSIARYFDDGNLPS